MTSSVLALDRPPLIAPLAAEDVRRLTNRLRMSPGLPSYIDGSAAIFASSDRALVPTSRMTFARISCATPDGTRRSACFAKVVTASDGSTPAATVSTMVDIASTMKSRRSYVSDCEALMAMVVAPPANALTIADTMATVAGAAVPPVAIVVITPPTTATVTPAMVAIAFVDAAFASSVALRAAPERSSVFSNFSRSSSWDCASSGASWLSSTSFWSRARACAEVRSARPALSSFLYSASSCSSSRRAVFPSQPSCHCWYEPASGVPPRRFARRRERSICSRGVSARPNTSVSCQPAYSLRLPVERRS